VRVGHGLTAYDAELKIVDVTADLQFCFEGDKVYIRRLLFFVIVWGCSLARDDDGLQKQANNNLLTAQG
jgi:hypothetical protein